MKFAKLTDPELYKMSKEYGLCARHAMRKFAGLLPEVSRRRLYRRRGFSSIHEYAAKLAGMSQRVTDKILWLGEKLLDKPKLLALFEQGKVGWSKLEKVAYCASSETDSFWAEKVVKLSKHALEVYIQEIRREQINRLESPPGRTVLHQHEIVTNARKLLSEDLVTSSVQSVETEGFLNDFNENQIPQISHREHFSFKVSPEVALKFRQAKQVLEKEAGETLTFNEVLGRVLEGAIGDAATISKLQKQITINVCPNCVAKKEQEHENVKNVTRHIPTNVRQLVLTRQENRCAYPDCNKPPEIFHHTRRFSLKRSHDPNFIHALCTAHERLAHTGLIKNEEQQPRNWRTKQKSTWWDEKTRIDQEVLMRRRE